jgi:iron complex transport system ATP-binding protein
MAQAVHVVFEFTVREIIKMGWVQGRTLSQTHFQRAASEVVNLCELEHLLDRAFNTLSGGEQQRVQFARNLLQLWRPPGRNPEARFLLLDEPTASMDLRHELMLLAQLRLAKEQNIGVLIVLHDLNLAARFMDRVVLMRYGQIVKAGSPQQVLDETLLSDVYQTPIRVEHNTQLNRMVVHT